MSLVERSVTSATWNVGANLLKVAILLSRSIILARLLPVETFGVYALAMSIVTFSGILPKFGLGGAFIHRSSQTANEDEAAAVFFTLRTVLTSGWAATLILAASFFAADPLREVIIVLTLVFAGLYVADTAKFILSRRVRHQRLAVLDLMNAVLTTGVAVFLAQTGYGLVALLSTDVITLFVTIFLLYIWRPIWRPRLIWLGDTVRYYLSFGRRTLTESALSEALDNLDDIWVGAYLGSNALGLYSRAFTFATYPRRLLAFPLFEVAGGTYAELKDDPKRLSQSFFRVNALLLRSGFFLGGLLVLIAPEFVRYVLGEQWLLMVASFQLMFVYTLLDPVRSTISQLFIAVGRPDLLIWPRVVQLAILVGGLFSLGRVWGINGVAITIDVMLVVGLVWLLVRARNYVEYSATRLFSAPLLALASGAAAASATNWLVCGRDVFSISCGSPWVPVTLKVGAFVLLFGMVLWGLEGRDLARMTRLIRRALFPPPQAGA